MELIEGNRLYRCSGCGKEVKVNMCLAGVPHCKRGVYTFIKVVTTSAPRRGASIIIEPSNKTLQ